MSIKKTTLIYCDGGCKDNGRATSQSNGSMAVFHLGELEFFPGDFANGGKYFKQCQDRPPDKLERFDFMESENYSHTNNQAEARIYCYSLNWAFDRGLIVPGKRVVLCNDSDLVRKHIIRVYKANNTNMRRMYEGIWARFADFQKKHGKGVLEHTLIMQHISGDAMKKTVIGH